MFTDKELSDLAALARLELAAPEKSGLAHDLDSILRYVDQLKQLPAAKSSEFGQFNHLALPNTWRSDCEPHPAGLHRAALLLAAPGRAADGFFKVKTILFPENEV